jgi:hypothetical protein
MERKFFRKMIDWLNINNLAIPFAILATGLIMLLVSAIYVSSGEKKFYNSGYSDGYRDGVEAKVYVTIETDSAMFRYKLVKKIVK